MKTFEQFNRELNYSQLDEGILDFLKGLFTNPIQKRKLRKLADELKKTIIDKMTLKIEGDPVEELEAELETQDPNYSYSPGKPSSARSYNGDENPHSIKIKMLEEKESDILAAMDEIGQENETLKKYVTTVKLEAKMEATEKLMRVADGIIRKKLNQMLKNDKKEVIILNKSISNDVKESLIIQEANETEAIYSDYPTAAKSNAKQAIEWRDKYGRDVVTGGTEVGWARANQLAKGEKLSRDVVSRMAQFNRHRKNSKIAAEFKDEPWRDRGYIAWLIWGGDEGVDWAMQKMEEIRTEETNEALILEIGDASANPFKWKADQNIAKEIKKLYDRVQKLEPYKHEEVEYTYSFKNDNSVEYVVSFKGWWQRQTSISLSGKPLRPTALYECSFNLSYNTEEDHKKGIEKETNLGDVFRIMATVTEITFDFLRQSERVGYPIKNLTITAKGDEGTSVGMDSRRGRLYLNYIKKQLNKAGTENPYTAFAAKIDGADAIEVRLGAWSGGSAIKTENKQTRMKHIKLFEQYITEARDSDYEMIVDLMLNAKPKYNVYYNSDWNVVNIGGTGYDKGDLVKQFGATPGSSSDIKAAFYRAAQSPEETKKAVEKLSKGKVLVDIESSLVKYSLK